MELIRRKVLLEDGISRNADTTWGLMTASTFYVNVMLTQDMDNMGLHIDIDYENVIPDYTILIDKLNSNGIQFPFMNGITPPSVILTGFTACTRVDLVGVSEWYKVGDRLTANTETRISELKSYNKNNRYIPNFNINAGTYTNYDNQLINGVSRYITNTTGNTPTYTFDANDDVNIGTVNQMTGLLYKDNIFTPNNPNTLNRKDSTKTLASVEFKAEGWNNTNTSLSALTKEEYLFGIINEPEVFSDVFIDRGATTVMEKHLKLSEVESLEHLTNFGNGFYNINKT